MRFARAGASSFTTKPYPEDADSWEDMITPIQDQLDVIQKPYSAAAKTADKSPKIADKSLNKRKHGRSRSHGIPGISDALVKQFPDLIGDDSDDSKPSETAKKARKGTTAKKNTSTVVQKQTPAAKKIKQSPLQKRKPIRTSSGSFSVYEASDNKMVKSASSSDESSSESDMDTSSNNRVQSPKIQSKNKESNFKFKFNKPNSDSSSDSDSDTAKGSKANSNIKSPKIQVESKSGDSSSESEEEDTSSKQSKLQQVLQARTKNQYGVQKAVKSNAPPKFSKETGERKCVKFGRHMISVEAHKEIKELMVKWKEEGRPDDVIAEAVKLRARRDEKMRKHQKKKMASMTCFACQETGHVIADCPAAGARGDGASGSGVAGICYTCGSTEHTSKDCKKQYNKEKKQAKAWHTLGTCSGCKKSSLIDGNLKENTCFTCGHRGVFSLATCFKCKKSGHIARQCEENTCFTCGGHGHIQRHCPKAGTGVKNVTGKE